MKPNEWSQPLNHLCVLILSAKMVQPTSSQSYISTLFSQKWSNQHLINLKWLQTSLHGKKKLPQLYPEKAKITKKNNIREIYKIMFNETQPVSSVSLHVVMRLPLCDLDDQSSSHLKASCFEKIRLHMLIFPRPGLMRGSCIMPPFFNSSRKKKQEKW